MESQNIEFRAVIKFLTKEGAKAKEIHRRMADVYGDSSLKYSTVAKWSAEFKPGRDSLEDDPRPGRPADVISQEMIDHVERLVLNNRRSKLPNLLLQQGISEPEFYGDLVYRFRKIVGKSNFSEQFRKLINRYKRIGYSLDIMRQTACLVVNQIIVDGYASLFNCTTAVRASNSMTASL